MRRSRCVGFGAAVVLIACGDPMQDIPDELRVASSGPSESSSSTSSSSTTAEPNDGGAPADDGCGVPESPPDGGVSTTGYSCPAPGSTCPVPDDLAPCCCKKDEVPPPGPSDETFACPIAEMEYIGDVCDSGANFDCDDFAYACQRWANAKGIEACQVWVQWYDDDEECMVGHAVTAIRRRATRFLTKRWSLVEPQNNHVYGSWNQGFLTGEPSPPQWVLDEVCFGREACEVYQVECDPVLPEGSGEQCFVESAALCQAFEDATGICSVSFEPLPD